MRRMIVPAAAAAALAAVIATVPAQAATHHRQQQARVPADDMASGGFGTGPYWRGEPTDHSPIWRYGYYQGNDPDQSIRFSLMRDGRNYTH
jgi:hypothetical protein